MPLSPALFRMICGGEEEGRVAELRLTVGLAGFWWS